MSNLTLDILIVEDNPADARLIETMLAKITDRHFKTLWKDSLAGALQAMQRQSFQAALLDLGLPDSQGLATLQQFRMKAVNLPIVVLTGLDDEQIGVASLREGAQDYLLKDELRPPLLSRAISYAIERQQILARLHQSQRDLQTQEAFFRSIVDTNPNFIFVKDAQGRYILANRALANFYNTTPEFILGKIEADLNPNPAQAEQHEREEREILETLVDKIVSQEPVRGADGELRWVQTIRKPLVVDDQADRILGVSIDITERQLAEARLWQQAERGQLLAKVTQQIRQSLELSQILTTAAARVRQALGLDRVSIYRCQGSRSQTTVSLKLEACEVLKDFALEKAKVQAPIALLDLVMVSGSGQSSLKQTQKRYQTAKLNDVTQVPLPEPVVNFLRIGRVKSLLVVPILRGDAIEIMAQNQNQSVLDLDGSGGASITPLWGLLLAEHREALQPQDHLLWENWEIEFLEQLVAQLSVAIQQAELYRRLEVAKQALERLAALDGLTGIPNRRSFDRALDREWLRLARTREPLSLIFGDIDSFKAYNDHYGHLSGDDCLRQVAKAIERSVRRSTDQAFRYGGEEFATILPNTDMAGAIAVAEAILTSVRSLHLPHVASSVEPHVTISLGVASLIPHTELSPSTLIAAADEALFVAKAQGRNRYQAADPKNAVLTSSPA